MFLHLSSSKRGKNYQVRVKIKTSCHIIQSYAVWCAVQTDGGLKVAVFDRAEVQVKHYWKLRHCCLKYGKTRKYLHQVRRWLFMFFLSSWILKALFLFYIACCMLYMLQKIFILWSRKVPFWSSKIQHPCLIKQRISALFYVTLPQPSSCSISQY